MNTIPLPDLLAMLQKRLGDTKIEGFVIGVYSEDNEMKMIADDNPLQTLALCDEMMSLAVQRVLDASQAPPGDAVH